jgi:hypothetical protein
MKRSFNKPMSKNMCNPNYFGFDSAVLKKLFIASKFLTILLAVGFADIVLNNQMVHAQSIDISSDGITTGISGLTDNGTLVTIDPTVSIDLNPSVIVGYLNTGLSVKIRNLFRRKYTKPFMKRAEGYSLLSIHANLRIFVWCNTHIACPSGKKNELHSSVFHNANDGEIILTGNLSTNEGDVWIGGNSNKVGSLRWDGLSIDNAPSVGSGTNASDLYANVTTIEGDIFIGTALVSEGVIAEKVSPNSGIQTALYNTHYF